MRVLEALLLLVALEMWIERCCGVWIQFILLVLPIGGKYDDELCTCTLGMRAMLTCI